MLPHAAADPLAAPSAQVIVPDLLALASPRSVVDIGCGTGAWIRSFMDHGITDVLGVDGPEVLHASSIPPASRLPHDLSRPLHLPRKYDLVVCLEVAEHLPAAAAGTLVSSIAAAGDLVLFSAAIPHQRGPGHVNLRWPAYWVDQLAARGFEAVDHFRPRLWEDERVAWWYRQNLLLLGTVDRLRSLGLQGEQVLPLVHPRCLEAVAEATVLRAMVARGRSLGARLKQHLPVAAR